MNLLESNLPFYLGHDVPWPATLACCILVLVAAYLTQFNGKDPNYHLWFEHPQTRLVRNFAPAETNVAKVLEESGRGIIIFYATQSGTSQRMAQNLAQAIDRRFSRQACVASLSDYDSSSIALIDRNVLAIFIMSTYGEGNPPDNALDFADWLRSDLPQSLLAGLRFAMLGLGSSNYKSYNQFSRTSFNLLRKAGAVPTLDLFLADDGKGMTEESYSKWTTELFRVMVHQLDMPEQPKAYEPFLEVQITGDVLADETAYISTEEPRRHSKRIRTDFSPVRLLPISSSRHLTGTTKNQVIHMDIDLSQNPELKYVTGDHVLIWPENEDSEVDRLCERLGISKEDTAKRLKIAKARPNTIWNVVWDEPCTIRSLLKRRLEIAAPVSREFIQELQEFAPSASAKSFLQSVSADWDRYMEYRSSKRISLASVLEDACPDEVWPMPISFVLERAATLAPRYYSISSAASVQPRHVSITVSVATLQLKSAGEIIRGLTSHYLSGKLGAPGYDGAETEYRVVCQIRKSRFRLPTTLSRPLIMVATGSGIAPFRGFIQHAVKQAKLGHDIGQLVLIFGCRGPEEHLYREEFESAVENLGGKLLTITAYSRFGEARGYVQDKLRQKEDLVNKLMVDQDGSLYICGSTSMASGVGRALSQILCQRKNWTETQYAAFEAEKKRSRRWQEDVWG